MPDINLTLQTSPVTLALQVSPGISVELSNTQNSNPSFIHFNVTLLGTIDGSNATFTTPEQFIPEEITVRVNGLSQRLIVDYNTSGNSTVLFTSSPQVGDVLTADYRRLN